MPLFKPFKGVRALESIIQNFATNPLDQMSREEAQKKATEEDTFLKMVEPFINGSPENRAENYGKIRRNFEKLREENKLRQDISSIYLYRQTLSDGTVYRGLLGLTSVDDYFNGKIRKHESVLANRDLEFTEYLKYAEIQSEPVLLTYRASSKLEILMDLEERTIPVYNFTDAQEIQHKLWRITDRLKLKQFKDAFDNLEAFYIADGHHRINSIALNAKRMRKEDEEPTGLEAYNYIYSYVISDQSIKINDFNRVVKDLNGLSSQEFLKALEEFFIVSEKGEKPYFPTQRYHMGLYLDGKFYSLHVIHNTRKKDNSLEDLDHYILEKNVLNGILNINSLDNSGRVDFVRGNGTVEGSIRVKEKVDSGEFRAGFIVYPVSYLELTQVSDRNEEMPPKCTYIEPKLKSGLVIYDMN